MTCRNQQSIICIYHYLKCKIETNLWLPSRPTVCTECPMRQLLLSFLITLSWFYLPYLTAVVADPIWLLLLLFPFHSSCYSSSLTADAGLVYLLFPSNAAPVIHSWMLYPQSNQSACPVRFLIFCSKNIILLASPVAGRKPQWTAGAD